jgi:hypothetical protein
VKIEHSHHAARVDTKEPVERYVVGIGYERIDFLYLFWCTRENESGGRQVVVKIWSWASSAPIQGRSASVKTQESLIRRQNMFQLKERGPTLDEFGSRTGALGIQKFHSSLTGVDI